MAEFTEHQQLYDDLRSKPDSVVDMEARRLYQNGLNDREMPEAGDTKEWAAWVAGRRTREDRR
jgi:hypothetical protein